GLQAALDLQPGLAQGLALLAGERGGQLLGLLAGVGGGPGQQRARGGGAGGGRDLLDRLGGGRVRHFQPVAAGGLEGAAADEHRPHGRAPSSSRRLRWHRALYPAWDSRQSSRCSQPRKVPSIRARIAAAAATGPPTRRPPAATPSRMTSSYRPL